MCQKKLRCHGNCNSCSRRIRPGQPSASFLAPCSSVLVFSPIGCRLCHSTSNSIIKSDGNRQSLREGFFFLIEKYHVAFRLFFLRFCILFLVHFLLFRLYPSLTYSSLLRRRPFIVYFLLILFAFSFRSFDSEKRDIFCLSIVCL